MLGESFSARRRSEALPFRDGEEHSDALDLPGHRRPQKVNSEA
jgi:hypothetical protein